MSVSTLTTSKGVIPQSLTTSGSGNSPIIAVLDNTAYGEYCSTNVVTVPSSPPLVQTLQLPVQTAIGSPLNLSLSPGGYVILQLAGTYSITAEINLRQVSGSNYLCYTLQDVLCSENDFCFLPQANQINTNNFTVSHTWVVTTTDPNREFMLMIKTPNNTAGTVIGPVTRSGTTTVSSPSYRLAIVKTDVNTVGVSSVVGSGTITAVTDTNTGVVTVGNIGIQNVTAGSGITLNTSFPDTPQIPKIINSGVTNINAGYGIGISGGTGVVTISNTGLKTVQQGAGILINTTTGGATIQNPQIINSGVLQLTPGSNITITGDNTNKTISFNGSAPAYNAFGSLILTSSKTSTSGLLFPSDFTNVISYGCAPWTNPVTNQITGWNILTTGTYIFKIRGNISTTETSPVTVKTILRQNALNSSNWLGIANSQNSIQVVNTDGLKPFEFTTMVAVTPSMVGFGKNFVCWFKTTGGEITLNYIAPDTTTYAPNGVYPALDFSFEVQKISDTYA